MKILITAATTFEINDTLLYLQTHGKQMDTNRFSFHQFEIDILITGIGMVNTTYTLTNHLHQKTYDLLINAGIGGAFDKSIELGTVFHVVSDRFGDLGTENADESFSDIFEMGLADASLFPFSQGVILADDHVWCHSIPKTHGITVNCVTGTSTSIQKLIQKYNPGTESMEGAAFMFVAKSKAIPHIQLRAISNHVETRNKNNWNIQLAIKNLNQVLLKMINQSMSVVE